MRAAGAFSADVRATGQTVFVALHGELDLVAVAPAREAIRRARCARDGLVVVDLGDVEFIDVHGLRLLLQAHTWLGRRLRLLPAAAPVQRIFAYSDAAERLPFAHGAR